VRLTAVVGSACLALCAAALGAVGAPPAGGTAADGSLGLTIASYDGDAVTTTPSETVQAGTDVTDEVTVSNLTASPQTNVSVPVDLPANFTLDGGTVAFNAGSTSVSADVLTWTIPTLGANGSATLSYTEATDAPDALESDVTSAAATSTQGTAAAVSASVEVIPAADLTISVTDGTDTIAPGASDTYTITLTNHGPSEAVNATVADTLTGGFLALSAVSSIGGTTFVDLGANQFEWTGINLASGASATFSLMGTVSTSLPAGDAFVSLVSGSPAPGVLDTAASVNAVDSDIVVLAPQAISFTPPTVGIVGQPATLEATGGGSGNPVVFSMDPSSGSGVCGVSGADGATLTYDQAGECVIDANQAGNVSYAAAPTVTATITVDQGPAFTLEAPPLTGTVGEGYAYTFAADGVPAPAFSLAAGAPSWLAIDATSGAVSGTPPAGTTSFSYSVVATNDVGSATAGPFAVSVSSPVSPPPTSPDADLSAALACPSVVPARTVASCTLTVANAGPAAARSVIAGLDLPFGFWPEAASGNGAWFGHSRYWWVHSLPSGASVAFTVSFRTPDRGRGRVVGFALSWSPDPDRANNWAVSTVAVSP
jgi:uncharacterized repeat protein (TIGR01451 family)